MTTVTYLKSVTGGVYSDEAFGYIVGMTEHILEASEILNISAEGHEGEWWGECLPGNSATGTVQSASNSKTGA